MIEIVLMLRELLVLGACFKEVHQETLNSKTISLIMKEEASRMKSSIPARIILATILLAAYMNMAAAEQENQTDNYAMNLDIFNNSSPSEMLSASNSPAIFDMPGFLNLTPNKTANYYYSKVVY